MLCPCIEDVAWVKKEPITIGPKPDKSVLVLEFWATWCGPCRKAIPHLTELAKKYHNAKFVGLTDDDEDKVKKFVADMGERMDYHVGISTDAMKLLDATGEKGIPTAMIFGRNRVLRYVGHPMGEEFEEELVKAIKSKS